MERSNNRAAQLTLLDGVTADTTGTAFEVDLFEKMTLTVVATGVTTGATFDLEIKDPKGNWVSIWNYTFGATGNQIQIIDTPLLEIRGKISSYTDGTFTATIVARR